MRGPDPTLSLWTAGIGLALFIYGFGSGAHLDDDFRMAFLVGLAGAVIFVCGLALVPVTPPDF